MINSIQICATYTLMGKLFVAMILLSLAIIGSPVIADPDNLQDLCVADLTSDLKLNGFPCKSMATASDFFFAGLATSGSTSNLMNSKVTTANVMDIPGLNTLGVSLARIDFAPGGINPPHIHPRATEIIFVLQGQLDVWFITTANVLISKTIKAGEIFTFPKALVHFQKNNGSYPASVLSAFNSQLPGTQSIAATLFTASPTVPNNVLAQAFQISDQQVKDIKTKLTPKA